MKILTLSIKRDFFDRILAGEKTHEYREVRPNNVDKYYRYELNGETYTSKTLPGLEEDEHVYTVPVKYDAIKFLTGAYSGKRPWILVEVKAATLQFAFSDESNCNIEPVFFANVEDAPKELLQLRYVYGEDGNEWYWPVQQMDYTLGDILEQELTPNKIDN